MSVPESHVGPPRRGWLMRRLAGVSDSPRKIAAAFALGVFLSFSPFLGLQVAAGLGLSIALRLNRAAVLVGLCTNLPWVMVPWYALTTAAGAAMLRVPLGTDVSARIQELFALPVYRAAFWEGAAEIAGPLLSSFLVGSTLGAMIVAAIAYAASVRIIARRTGGASG